MKTNLLFRTSILSLLLVCSAGFSFAQNERALVNRILKNPEYQAQWSSIEKMRGENTSDQKILDYLNGLSEARAKQAAKLNVLAKTSGANDNFFQGPPPVTNATCSGLGVETGWGAWQSRTGSISSGTITWDAAGWVAPVGPRFNLTSGTGTDACTPGPVPGAPTLPVVCPGFGNASIQLGQPQTNGSLGGCGATMQVLPPPFPPQFMPAGCVEQLTYPLSVTASDTNFVYSYAVVIEDPGHPVNEQPFVSLGIYDQAGNAIPCGYFKYTAGNLPGFDSSKCNVNSGSYYKSWTLVGVNLAKYINTTVNIVITNADCGPNGHFAHSYFDFRCGTLTGSLTTGSCGASSTICGPVDPQIGYTYQWFQNGSPYIGPPNATAQCINPVVQPGDVFSVLVTQPSGCNFYLVYTPQPLSSFTVATSATPATCGSSNGTATALASGGPYTYLWSTTPPQNSPTATGLASGTYTVTVTDNTGCSAKQFVTISNSNGPAAAFANTPVCIGGNPSVFTDNSIAIQGDPIAGWVWDFGDGASAAIQNPSHTYSTAGTFVVTLTITSQTGCTGVVTQTVSVSALPNAVFSSSPPCLGSAVTLMDGSVSSAGNPIMQWSWNMPGANPSTSTAQNASATYLTAGSHTVSLEVTSQQGCKNSISQQVFVYAPPVANLSGSGSGCAPPVCVNNFADLSTSSDGNITGWNWSFPGGSPATYSGQTPPQVCYNTPGNYGASLTVISQYGCSNTVTAPALINMYGLPKAEFCVSPAQSSTSDPVFNFCDLWSTDVVAWEWDFGDGTTLAGTGALNTDPAHSYSASVTGNDFYTFNVCLKVQNQQGCWSTVCHTVELRPEFEFYIPNAFTPNNDSKNETFFGKGRGIKEYDIWIFDRWGNAIWDCHESSGSADWDALGTEGLSSACKWDGKNAGKGADMSGNSGRLQEEDVYIWKVRLIDIFSREHSYVGHVSIVR